MPRFELRAPSIDQAHLILGFIKELAEYEQLSHECLITEESLQDSLFRDEPHAESLIAFLDEKPIGFCLYFFNYSTFLGKPGLYLEDLYIQPDYRNNGYGKRILARLASIALERGCGRFEWAVLDWNEPSIAFYRKLGAEPMIDWTVQRLTGQALEDLSRFSKSNDDV